MKLRRKRLLWIMGVKHKVRHIDTGDKGGFYSASDKLLEIDRDVKTQELYDETIFHEGCHGVFQVTGIHQDITLPQEHVIIDSIWSFIKANFNIELKK